MDIIIKCIRSNVGIQGLALIALVQQENYTLYLYLGLDIRILFILSFIKGAESGG